MKLMTDSITIVLLGDWSKLYIQPEWVAENIFENPEIEIGIEGRDTEFHISYRNNGVIIKPSQNKIVLTAVNAERETIENLSKYANNYLNKAVTPAVFAYGLNIDFADAEDTRYAEVLDNMSDTAWIIELGYQIEASEISRRLSKNGKIINMKCNLVNSKTTMHFNEHFANPTPDNLNVSAETIFTFIDDVKQIILQFGYEIEGDADE